MTDYALPWTCRRAGAIYVIEDSKGRVVARVDAVQKVHHTSENVRDMEPIALLIVASTSYLEAEVSILREALGDR